MNIENLDLSEETNDVLKRQPHWITRFGNILIFIIIMMLIFLTSIIKYNDVINASIVVTSKNPPVNIIAKSSGILTQINAKENQKVLKSDVLGVIKNNANFDDIKSVKSYLKLFVPTVKDFDSLSTILNSDVELGEVQRIYNNFRLSYQNYLNHVVLNPEKNRIDNYNLQMISKQKSLKNNLDRLQHYRLQVANTKKIFIKNTELYKKGIISEIDYINNQSMYLKAKEKYQELKSIIENKKSNVLISQDDLTQTSIKNENSLIFLNQNLEQSKQELINSIKEWEQKYVLSSPINGKLTLFDIWHQYQDIKTNEIVFTIVPNELNGLIGRVLVPINNSGKVKSGQNVLIKLRNYPYQEWGKLKGKIISISNIPKAETSEYIAIVELNSLITSYNKVIEFKQKMEGEAEIIVDEITLLERLLYPIKDIFN
ncbi:HlyD family efflux transporter periplasmic adaptor subunit [uncultured Algibacter sp.]|uniref:HlyD family efflux transporter periplasmic adaptor subunit n=1 Tax=uncultured Algibacter sp. TaxID=298659 RepID=UPI003217E509